MDDFGISFVTPVETLLVLGLDDFGISFVTLFVLVSGILVLVLEVVVCVTSSGNRLFFLLLSRDFLFNISLLLSDKRDFLYSLLLK